MSPADLLEENNRQRYLVRRAARVRREAAADGSRGGTTERSLPSGPAPQPLRDVARWAGFLALVAGLMAFRQIRNRWWGIRDETSR